MSESGFGECGAAPARVGSQRVGGVESGDGGIAEQAAVQPEHMFAQVLFRDGVEDGQGGGVEQVACVGGGEGLGLVPGPGADPVIQDLGQAVGPPPVRVGGVRGVGAV